MKQETQSREHLAHLFGMIDNSVLADDDTKKIIEIDFLCWFLCCQALAVDEISLSEQPDFIVKAGNRVIGIEITEAHRSIKGEKFPAAAIEASQNEFAKALLEQTNTASPLTIYLSFIDEVKTQKDMMDAVAPVAASIEAISHEMTAVAANLVREEKKQQSSSQPSFICLDIPPFISQITLVKSEMEGNRLCASRGGVVEHFGDEDLSKILDKKHKLLKNYHGECDEHWLVIVANANPIMFSNVNIPHCSIPSASTSFAEPNLEIPIQSDFDRVYFFNVPNRLHTLKE